MERAIKEIEIWRVFSSGEVETRPDEVLEESSFILEVDRREEATVILSPGEEKYWALGHLRCRRMILSMDDVEEISLGPGRIRIVRKVTREGIPLKNRFVHTASTGLVEETRVREAWPTPLPIRWSVTFPAIHTAVEDLARAPLFRRTGSVHVALLASLSGERLFRVEDVGRHNAVDKAVGWALCHGVDLQEAFMVVSGRLPADMVYKAIGAGIPLLASVSATTASGVEAAEWGGITLIGFAREGRMNVYTHPQRIQNLRNKNLHRS